MKMKVTAFNGSPRKGGNTEILLKKVLEPITAAGIKTELIHIGNENIKHCTACYKCRENKDKKCVIDNDNVNDYITKMAESDAIIFGSPTYFADMTAPLKALSDRAGFVSYANDRMFARKIGAAVVAVRRGGAVHVLDSINHMFLMSRMIVPGSTYWNFGFGLGKGEVKDDAEGIVNMTDLGETIAWLIKKINS
jgi:multimeric flavodoxin WrbA